MRARRVRRLHALSGEGRRAGVRGAAGGDAGHRHLNKAPHPEAAKLFVDWALSKRGQLVYQNQKILLYGSVRPDTGPMPTGKKLADFKLLFPTDWNDYVASHPVFVKEWNSIMGL